MIRWTLSALADFELAMAHVAWDDEDAARGQARRIHEAASKLAAFPELGRAGRVTGTRELVIPRTPYVLVYRYTRSGIEVLRLLHEAMRWPDV